MKKMMIVLAVMVSVISAGCSKGNSVAWSQQDCSKRLDEMRTAGQNLASEMEQDKADIAIDGVSSQLKGEYETFMGNTKSFISNCRSFYSSDDVLSIIESMNQFKEEFASIHPIGR